MKVLDIPSSGKRGTVVAYQSRFGLCHRALVVPANTQTPARQHMRRAFGNFARAWGGLLTQAQRDLWDQAGPKVQSATRLGSGPLTGQRHFQGINSARACIGLPPLWEPPAPVVFDRNPIGQLIITNDESGVRLRLKVGAPVTGDIMVFGQAPCSAGRRKRRNVSYLGLLSAAEDGLSDITSLYIARFGEPRPGQRVFIVTRQQKDGWENYDQQTTEIVPPQPQQPLPAAASSSSLPFFPSLPSPQSHHALPTPASTLLPPMHKGCTRDAQGTAPLPTPDIVASNKQDCAVKEAAVAALGSCGAERAGPGPAG
jgi:hypothetical protein